MSTPTISVVVPTYEAAPYVERAVSSILAQTFQDFELVVVDDGSCDDTVDLVESIDDDRIRVIVRENETGITSALNRGIEESNGRYIARHDADDWSAPRRFEIQVRTLESNPELALVGTGAYLVDERGDVFARRRVLERPSLSDLRSHNEFVHGTVLMRRDALEAVDGYDEWFETAEDYDLWLRLADRYTVGNVDRPLYYFRQHDSSVYGRDLERLKLYHHLAVRRTASGIDRGLRSLIDREGIGAFYDRMSPSERRAFHTELAKEFLRYGDLPMGRTHSRQLVACSSIDPMGYVLLLLSYTHPTIATGVARAYRRVLNVRLALRNRLGPSR